MTVGHYASAVTSSAVMELLKPFDPRIVGTLPLGLAVPGSDIDIVCHAPDPNAFADIVWTHCQSADDFVLYRWAKGTCPAIARFVWDGWPFELFGDQRPVNQQQGWIHFEAERRLLALDNGRLRRAVGKLRADGLKDRACVRRLARDTGRSLSRVARTRCRSGRRVARPARGVRLRLIARFIHPERGGQSAVARGTGACGGTDRAAGRSRRTAASWRRPA
ncbi:hypothetical protein ACVWW1_004211 [Bradyrhizobium sp. JR3.5]